MFRRFTVIKQIVMKKILFSLLLVISFFSCNKNDAVAEVAYVSAVSLPSKEYKEDDYTVDSASASVDENIEILDDKKEKIESKIIKNGELRFETDDLEKTYNQVQKAVAKYKANIQNDSEEKNNFSIFKILTIRVPSQNFDAFIKDISTGVSYFDTREISSEDVTEEYIDVDSRIKTKKVLEIRYLELLKKATKVSEMMEVEKQLSEIREEIEAKEGRLKYLKNRVAMSSVTINFYKTLAQESGATVSYGTKIGNAIKSGFNGLSSFFIWLIEVWPFIIILVALIYLIRKRFKKKIIKENV